MFVDKILEAYDVERIAELCEQDQQIAPYCRMAGRRSGRLVLAASRDEQQGTAPQAMPGTFLPVIGSFRMKTASSMVHSGMLVVMIDASAGELRLTPKMKHH